MRTAIFTLGPLAIGAAQLVNAYVHGADVRLVAAVTLVMVLFSAFVTRYHLATFRLYRLRETERAR